MLLYENIILAINGLLANKMRALLTMLGIIIGIGSVIAIMTVGDSLTLSMSENMQELGANNINVIVQQRGNDEELSEMIDGIKYGKVQKNEKVTSDDLISTEMIEQLCNKYKDDIYAVTVSNGLGSGTASVDNTKANITVSANSVGYYITSQLELVAGSMFTEEEFTEKRKVAIVSDKLTKKLFGEDTRNALGKEVTIDITTSDDQYISMPFSIVGVYKYEESAVMGQTISNDDTATEFYIPLRTGNEIAHLEDRYQYIQVISKVGVDADEFGAKIEKFFDQYYKSNSSFTVKTFTLGSMVSMLTDLMGTLTLAISIVAGIALLVGGIGVMNIMLVSITERTREIGTRKALGAKNSSIRIQFIVEAMIICLIGGAIGVALGILGGSIAAKALDAPAHPSLKSIGISLLFSMGIGVFFGYYPANKAAKMNPIDALRYE